MNVWLASRMPLSMAVRYFWTGMFGSKAKKKMMRSEIAKRMILKVNRSEIPWNPVIEAKLCTGCASCATFCPKSVFSVHDGVVVVANPSSCVLFCSHCIGICPRQAISFPSARHAATYVRFAPPAGKGRSGGIS